MEKIIKSLEDSIKSENWYAVLMLSLTIPDIASKIDYPKTQSNKDRYVNWFNMYILEYYTKELPSLGNHVFLNGSDCYALRCTFLHEGGSSISHQRARKALDNFQFTMPVKGSYIHRNLTNGTLQLQIDEFAKDIIKGVQNWLTKTKADKAKMKRLDNILTFISF